MAILIVPTSTEIAHYTQRTVLDGTSFQLEFIFNEREGSWYLSILSEEGDDLIMGIKIVADWPLLRRQQREDTPPGELIALDTTGEGLDPGFADLGGRVILLYGDEAEIGAL